MSDKDAVLLRCEIEGMVSEREGMLAENEHCKAKLKPPKYGEEAFFRMADSFLTLRRDWS